MFRILRKIVLGALPAKRGRPEEFPVSPPNFAAASAQLPAAIRVTEVSIYRGPHLYSNEPMIRIQVDLGSLEQFPSNRLPRFTETLLTLLPGLHEHGCSYREPGGFVRRLQEGTWMGHVAEHVALELQTRCGSRATRGKTRSVPNHPGRYNIMYVYREVPIGLLAGRLALELVSSLLPPELRGVEGLERIYDDPELARGR